MKLLKLIILAILVAVGVFAIKKMTNKEGAEVQVSEKQNTTDAAKKDAADSKKSEHQEKSETAPAVDAEKKGHE